MNKKYVYIVHPLFGDGKADPNANYIKISNTARLIKEREPDVVILSPVHMCSFFHPWNDPENDAKAREVCLEYLDIADEVRVFGDYKNSKGCMREIERAWLLGIEVVYEDGTVELSAGYEIATLGEEE